MRGLEGISESNRREIEKRMIGLPGFLTIKKTKLTLGYFVLFGKSESNLVIALFSFGGAM